MIKATENRLIKEAKNYGTFKEFADSTGWEDWMCEYCENHGYEYITEADNRRIDAVLADIWKRSA